MKQYMKIYTKVINLCIEVTWSDNILSNDVVSKWSDNIFLIYFPMHDLHASSSKQY